MAARNDIQYLSLEAKSRWLRPAEICVIIQSHQSSDIALEPSVKPPSGSLWLFNRIVLRGFRKDGHNWCKHKDGSVMKEGHERLKVGGVDVLHCYYAHGEESKSFHRRSYSMLDEAYKHIVLVHYREVKKLHLRGYKGRKHHRRILKSFRIVEIILRWRRKGSGFRREAHIEGFTTRTESSEGYSGANSIVEYSGEIRKFQSKVIDDRVLHSLEAAGAYDEEDQMSVLLSVDYNQC